MYTWILERNFVITWASLVILFYIATLAGVIQYHIAPEGLRDSIASWIREYYGSRVPDSELGPAIIIALFAVILINNMVVVIVAGLLSVTIVVPLLIMLVNGLLVGFVVPLASDMGGVFGGGYSYISIYLSLAPHGVIEIPAIALASSAFAIALTRGFRVFISSLPGILILALSMIAVAALVESTVTVVLSALVAYIT
jgi:stage II sporulation protein M